MRRNSRFTLIEVVVALAILAGSVSALITLMMSSQKRLAAAWEQERRWVMIQQAAEYCMLQDGDPADPPPEVFYYPGYHAKYTVDTSPFMDDNDLNDENALYQLDCRTVELIRDSDGQTVDQLKIDCPHYDED